MSKPRNHGQNVKTGGKGRRNRARIWRATGLYEARKSVVASSMTCTPNATAIAVHAAANCTTSNSNRTW